MKGLEYQKQGESLYARLRVMNKATGKRDHHPLGPVPDPIKGGASGEVRRPDPRVHLREVARRDQGEGSEPAAKRTGGHRHHNAGQGQDRRGVWETYEKIELGRLTEKTAKQSRQYAKRFVLPALGDRPVGKVTKQECAELHAGLAKTPYQANQVLSLMRTVFGKGVEWSWTSANPASGIKPFQEHAKEDWYTSEELGRLISALEANPTTQTRAILLMLYTGARVGEVLKATWDQFDLDAGTWTKSATGTKQKRIHHVALNDDALGVLRAVGPAAGYVFPSPFVPGRPLKDVDRTWDRAVKDAGVRRLRLYDLRHSVASVLASSGVDLYVIGKQLGHSQAKTSARYAHLSVDAQREAARKFGELVRRAPTKGRKKG